MFVKDKDDDDQDNLSDVETAQDDENWSGQSTSVRYLKTWLSNDCIILYHFYIYLSFVILKYNSHTIVVKVYD